MNTNQTPNTAVTVAAITVTTEAADIWSAIAAGELSRDMILADYRRADEEHNAMVDAIGDKLNDGLDIKLARAAWDECDAKLAAARKRRDDALAAMDDFMGEVA